MIKITNKAQCCGCTACASVCAQNAIEMKPDGMGFMYPEVDGNRCVECGMCEKVCSFNDNYDTHLNLPSPDVYGARHKDMEEVETSRSGASFIAISDYIFRQGGVVYGAGYKDHFRVAHKRATTKEERDEFKGSKYVQSDLDGVFREIKNDLKEGRTVLFSGTPCQTSGLNAYVGRKLRSNLFLVDIVCHGVPGPYVWRDYIAHLEEKQGDTICEVNFRDKQMFGWYALHESFKFVNGGGRKVTFKPVFYQHIMFRQSCGVCHFCNTKRPSDITIADFWGWEKTSPDFNKDGKGVSLILINTEKGRQLFDSIKGDLNYFSAELQNVLQTHLRKPLPIHPLREEFEKDYVRHGIVHAFRKFGIMGWRFQFNRYKKAINKRLSALFNKR